MTLRHRRNLEILRGSVFICLSCIAVSFILYYPVLNHFFVSDDFQVLHRVCLNKTLRIPGFFRPLSDLTIYGNFLLGSLNPKGYYAFNILVHGINAFLIYKVCSCLAEELRMQETELFAWISAALFLTYPFHNEGIVWILGRGASMATLFALAALWVYFRVKNQAWKILGVCGSYFMSLTAFESAIFLPVMIWILIRVKHETAAQQKKWMLSLFVTLAFHMIVRTMVSGSVLGPYGKGFLEHSLKPLPLNALKVLGRLLLPPTSHSAWFLLALALILGILSVYLMRNLSVLKKTVQGKLLFVFLIMLCFASVPAVFTSVSTQTSESDRMLYFPSVFSCCLISLILINFFRKKIIQLCIFSLLLVYNIYFLQENNKHWRKASGITRAVVETMGVIRDPVFRGNVYYLNIPNEIEGAYVFRHGFYQAAMIFVHDSSRVKVVNYLPRQDMEKMKERLVLKSNGNSTPLPPDIILQDEPGGFMRIIDHGRLAGRVRPEDLVYFWNVDRLQLAR